jgi:hypothetical protein
LSRVWKLREDIRVECAYSGIRGADPGPDYSRQGGCAQLRPEESEIRRMTRYAAINYPFMTPIAAYISDVARMQGFLFLLAKRRQAGYK